MKLYIIFVCNQKFSIHKFDLLVCEYIRFEFKMAIDGSFSLESALERFLSRCPKLGCLPRFSSLAKKVCLTILGLFADRKVKRYSSSEEILN